jgi:UDP-N-acetylmuramoyl-L-alanyl-D-glutamate--2,6-diaminopimelate ligase
VRHEVLDDVLVAQPVAAADGIVEVVVEAVVRADDTGRSAFRGHGVAAHGDDLRDERDTKARVTFGGIAVLTDVPGRFQVVSGAGDDVRVVVDYAHTDDALKNLLETARPLSAGGRVVTVFGCGGDRDRTKRPLMGAVAARLSDLVVITSDNPRSEDPTQIIEEIKRGIVVPADRTPPGGTRAKSTPHIAVVDRKAAIERAIREAGAGDLVLIAGKGHEKYQVIGDKTLPFDDVEIARAALSRRRTGSRVS